MGPVLLAAALALLAAPAWAQAPADFAPAAEVAAAAKVAPRATAISARMTLKVVHPEQVRAEIIKLVKDKHGFPTLVTDRMLHLKVPPADLDELLRLVAKKGVVLDKALTRQDRTEAIAQLEGRQRSKNAILQRLRGFLDDSNVAGTLTIERSMTQLVSEVEGVRGKLRVDRERARYAVVQISFDFHRQGRVTYVRSPFMWLNSVDLDRFLQGF